MSLLDQIAGVSQRLLRPQGGCHNCPRRRVDFVPATLVQGPVLWLGEAPGATEVEEQEGFVGKSGQLLRRLAREARVPEPWSFSNTIHCRPPENATPKPKEVECCLSQFVLDEIRGYPIVVLVGSVPLQAIFPGAQATHFRGNVAWHPDFPGQRFYAIYHPAYLLRRPDLDGIFRRHLERLARIALGEPPVPWRVVSDASALDVLTTMAHGPLLSLDLETTSVESWEPGGRIRSFCATADGRTVVAVAEGDPWFQQALEQIRAALARPELSVVGANPAFDLEWLERELGCRVQCTVIHDAALWWYEAGQYQTPSLKQLVAEQLDGYRYLIYQPHLTQDLEALRQYNAEDVIYALQLVQAAARKVKPATRELVTRVFGPASLVLRRMQGHGLYLRRAYQQQKIDEYQEKRRVAVEAWAADDPAFVPTKHESGKGLLQYLFTLHGLPQRGTTENGAPATDKAALKQWVREGHTYLRHLLKIREYDKLLSTYLTAYDRHVATDGRIHPKFWLTSTDTSRPSSSDPNLYNVPRNTEIRDLFGVPPGSALVEADLNQIEFRIAVCLAHDEQGIAGYLRGDDAHTMTARTLAGTTTPTKAQRSEAKPVNFALIYGGDWPLVQRVARDDYEQEWSETRCRDFTRGFFTTYPRIKAWHQSCKERLVANRGWFESVTGHVFYYRDWDHQSTGARDHAVRAAINAEAQGPASNLCLYIAVLARRLLDARGLSQVRFINSVYDSIMLEVPDPQRVPEVVAAMEEAAQQARAWIASWFVVPLVVNYAAGESWGSLKEIE